MCKVIEMFTVVFGESTMSRTQVQLWYNRLKGSREDVNDDARPSGLSTSITDEKIQAVKKMILNNRYANIISNFFNSDSMIKQRNL